VPTIRIRPKMVGMLRFAHPTEADYDAATFRGCSALSITNPS
jgi:hypothetical protein